MSNLQYCSSVAGILAVTLLAATAIAGEPALVIPAQHTCEEIPWDSMYDASPVFSTDGMSAVFMRGRALERRLYGSRRVTGGWTTPSLLPFSGSWMDIEPAMSPDGSYLVFASNRPVDVGTNPLDANYGGQHRPGRGGNLWRVSRTTRGWGTPERMPDEINAGTAVYAPSVASDGSVYFMRAEPDTGEFRLYRSLNVNGIFQNAAPLPFSNGVTADFDPSISPDQSTLVFTSDRPSPMGNPGRMFVAYQASTGWSKPVPLKWYGTEARLAKHGMLYFTGTDHCVHRVKWRRGATGQE